MWKRFVRACVEDAGVAKRDEVCGETLDRRGKRQ
jgi:hypothetical protein